MFIYCVGTFVAMLEVGQYIYIYLIIKLCWLQDYKVVWTTEMQEKFGLWLIAINKETG